MFFHVWSTGSLAGPPKPRKSEEANSPGEGITFQIGLNIGMKEIGSWSPERITSFFDGVAKVLTAKSGLDGGNKQ